MSAIFNVVLPVFGIMLTGYLAGRLKLLGEASSEALNRFVYYAALPALFFISLARAPLGEVMDGPFLAAFGGAMVGTFGLTLAIGALAFPGRLGALGLHAICGIFSNTGYLGLPLLLVTFGEAGKLPGIITTVITGVVVIGLGAVLLEFDVNRGGGAVRVIRAIVLGLAKSPLLLSAAAGMAVSALALPMPGPLATFCDILGAAAGPAALFAIGLFLVGQSLKRGYGEIAWLTLVKLFVHPALTWWLAYRVLALDPVWAASAVIQAALPTGVLVFVLAQQYGIYGARASGVILVTTILSVATLSALFLLLGLG